MAGLSFSQIFCPFPIVFVPVKEFTRIVMVNSLEQGEAAVEVATTRTVEPSVNIDEVTKSEEAVAVGP